MSFACFAGGKSDLKDPECAVRFPRDGYVGVTTSEPCGITVEASTEAWGIAAKIEAGCKMTLPSAFVPEILPMNPPGICSDVPSKT